MHEPTADLDATAPADASTGALPTPGSATHDPTAAGHPIARVLPLLSPAHLDRDFDYLVPPELDDIAQPGVRVRVRFAGRLVDGYLLARLAHSDHTGKMVELERVVSAERVLTPEILRLATAVAARYAGTRADVLRLAIPPRHARTEKGGSKKAAESAVAEGDSGEVPDHGQAGPRAASPADSAAGRAATVPLTTDLAAAQADSAVVESGDIAPADPADSTLVSTDSPDRVEGATMGSPSPKDDPVAGVTDSGVAATATTAGSSVGVEDKESGVTGGFVAAETDSGVAATAVSGGGAVSGDVNSRDVGINSAGINGAEVDNGGVDDATGDGADRGADPSDTRNESGVAAVDTAPWERYVHGTAFVGALGQGKGVRAAWQALPGEDWPRRLAELAAVVAGRGRSAILMVPDQRDLDRVLAECIRLVGDSAVGLAAGLGPAARYRRWLAALRGTARVVVGTRSAVFAPATDLGLIAIWDDGDDTYAEPRAPYPHAREVAMLRAHETGAAFVAAGFARTAEIQAVVESGWAHDLVADRAVLRQFSPRISAPGDTDLALERDPVARAVRIPGVAYAAARSALKEGAGVLVQVPRRGYIPSLACTKCRTPARCRHCNGPLALPDGRAQHGGDTAYSPACRWCGITEAAFRCPACASRALRAVVIGAVRTAEELGRAFPGVPIRGSSGGAMLDTVEPGPQVVVATVGAEPVLPGGYGVALLLDGWALLGRADLRAAEDALRRWMTAATLVRARGQVIVMAEPSLPTVQALLRWDPLWHANAELEARTEVGFPPAVRMAAIDGTAESIAELLSAANLPDNVDQLGPVPLPPGARKPFNGSDSPAEVERMLLRVHRTEGTALARALTAAQAVRSTHRSDAPLRVQIDPVDIG